MYSKELEELIEAAIADGTITEQEQNALIRRAMQEGVDPNELAVVVNGRLDKIRQQKEEAQKTNKEKEKLGSVLKCPQCGAVVNRMMGKCPECGHFFTGVKAGETIRKISEKMSSSKWNLSNVANILSGANSDVLNMAVPNSKEELMDIMLFLKNQPDEKFNLYQNKLNECIERSKILFPDDRELMSLVSECERKMHRKKKKKKKGNITALAIILGFILFIGCGIFLSVRSESNDRAKVEEQLNKLSAQIDALPTPTEDNIQDVTHKINQIVWQPIDANNNILEDAVTTFVTKKNGYIHSINALGVGETIPDDKVENYLKATDNQETTDDRQKEKPKNEVQRKVDEQYETLVGKLDGLPDVTTNNYEEVAADLSGFLWEPITTEAETAEKTFKSPSKDEKYERKKKEQWYDKVKAYAKKMNAFYKKNKDSLGGVDNSDIETLAKEGHLE